MQTERDAVGGPVDCPVRPLTERLRARKADRSLHEEAAAEIERLQVGHERYETARRMSPRQWADAWKLNISTGKPFDEIVDDLRPFLRPNVPATGHP